MDLASFTAMLQTISKAPKAAYGVFEVSKLRPVCSILQSAGGRLIAIWGSDERESIDAPCPFALHLTFALGPTLGLVWIAIPLETPEYPSIHDIFPAALRMQRAAFDLSGLSALNSPDTRKWLRHGAWPQEAFPLQKRFSGSFRLDADDYPFVAVEGAGVSEIPVGPVHAGTIEPGHFRFSVVGEKVLRLEERLGYTHKGIEKRFESLGVMDGARLAGRISGDSTVAYAWAYAMAIERATGTTPPQRALWLRALWLERERVMNHLGDLGAIANDAGFAFGFAQFSRLKEDLLRKNFAMTGHRYLMDAVVPGGVASDPGDRLVHVVNEAQEFEAELGELKAIYDDHAGLQDRFRGTGRLSASLAARLGVVGLTARASGKAMDLRVDFPSPPYDQLNLKVATAAEGDVAARVAVRFAEIQESLRLWRIVAQRIPSGSVLEPIPTDPPPALGVGWVEGWRGEVLITLVLGNHGALARVHAHDPSWQNWPALEHAALDNIVPDFPLINKSFNLSYSGHDL